jgi:hypothetical protein
VGGIRRILFKYKMVPIAWQEVLRLVTQMCLGMSATIAGAYYSKQKGSYLERRAEDLEGPCPLCELSSPTPTKGTSAVP